MKPTSSTAGLTLLELLIAIAIASVLGLAMVSLNMSQSRLGNAQANITEMQQNLRAAVFYMTRDIRMAGYNPTFSAGTGFDVTFSGAKMLSNHIAFTRDMNGDGTIDNDWTERVAYRQNGTRLERCIIDTGGTCGSWNLVAENIDILNFVYLDSAGNPTNTPGDVRRVQMSIIARTRGAVPSQSGYVDRNTYTNMRGDTLMGAPNDSVRRIQLSENITIRNPYYD